MRKVYPIALFFLIMLFSGCPETVIIDSQKLPDRETTPEYFKKPFPEKDIAKSWTILKAVPAGIPVKVINKFSPPKINKGEIKDFLRSEGSIEVGSVPKTFIINSYLGNSGLRAVVIRENKNTDGSVKGYNVRLPQHVNRTSLSGKERENDLGFIAPVVIKEIVTGETKTKQVERYIMWYTKVSKVYDITDTPGNLIRKFYYKYTPMCISSSTPESIWESYNVKVLGLDDYELSEELKGGVIVSDAMKVGESYTLWYLGKKTKDGKEDGWKLYSAPWDVINGKWDLSNLYLTKGLDVIGFDTDSIGKGSVYYDSDQSVYKIWYSGKNGKMERIGLGYTSNGFTDTYKEKDGGIYSGQPNRFDSENVADPFVLKDGELYRMWYSGFNGKRWDIGMAYSWDGIHFKYSEGSIFSSETDDFRYPCIIKLADDSYMMWYSRKGTDGIWKIEMAKTSLPSGK